MGAGLRDQCNLTMKQMGLVVPADSGLAASGPERAAMLALATSERQVLEIDPEEVALRKVLNSGTSMPFTSPAMVSQGRRPAIPPRSGSRQAVAPARVFDRVVANLGRQHPVVFLNACEIGRAGKGLTRPGGWPLGFLAAGAGAFVGPFWKVADASAATFASCFYRALLAGQTLGAAARAARLAIQAASDPTWLAYSVYAHNDARLS